MVLLLIYVLFISNNRIDIQQMKYFEFIVLNLPYNE